LPNASDWIGIVINWIALEVSFAGLFVTAIGLLIVLYQIRKASHDTTAGALLTSIDSRWQTIEEMKYRLRVDDCDLDVKHEGIKDYLGERLETEFDNDTKRFGDAFDLNRIDLDGASAETVIGEAIKEYRIRDLIFSLCEDEYMAYRLELIQREKLWRYWKWYLDQTFKDDSAIHYWKIRQRFGTTYVGFVDFVESTYFDGQM
jgi:hypothetical protein